ncbi:Uncharacterized protein OBRU01_08096 [Operophtera brumata]|uniref:Uncharacterized protein n=1 Tax=Operophtera brumata TaxID=104452 RepID=A0A0L7LBZ7_OPEBR|nr:Uncharacterized protein OBRU01_08096 [Operophtera brumata]
MPRCLMAKKWKTAPAAYLGDDTDEEIDVVGEGRGRSPAPAATAPGPPPRDPESTLLYNGIQKGTIPFISKDLNYIWPAINKSTS